MHNIIGIFLENILQVCVRVIFYLETWSSPDMTRSLIGQLLMSYTICFPTKRRIETVPPAEDFHEDTLRKIGSTIYSPTSRKKEACLSVCLRPVCVSTFSTLFEVFVCLFVILWVCAAVCSAERPSCDWKYGAGHSQD